MQASKIQKTQNFTGIDPARLSRELRQGQEGHLAERRSMVGLSYVTLGCMALIGLYQSGILKHLPEPPLPWFNADKVDASEQAYGRFSMPDGFLGLSSFSTTAMLISMGGEDRARKTPWIPLLMAVKLAVDVIQAAKLTWDQYAKHKAVCFWCLLTSLSVFAMVPLAWREISEALQTIGRKSISNP